MLPAIVNADPGDETQPVVPMRRQRLVFAPGQLVGLTEIARMLGVVPSAVSNWLKRDVGFPEPWGVWACGPLYLRDEVQDWHANRPVYPSGWHSHQN